MKKILLAVTAALAITGCSQNEEFDSPSQKAEINFSTAAVTRATAMITDNFKQFKVYGYAHTGEFTTETESKTLVEGIFNKSEDKKWSEKDSNKFYWYHPKVM
ncbi:fimbrillin family protein [Bacteroides ovatus]|nr:fimbrillin family protein [Bacteroides ovatus]